MFRLVGCAALLLSLTFVIASLRAQSTGDIKKDAKQEVKKSTSQEPKQKKEKYKPDWIGEFAGSIKVLDEKDTSRLNFTVLMNFQYTEINSSAQQEIERHQLKLSQLQVQLAQSKTATSRQSIAMNMQTYAQKLEQAKAKLITVKNAKLDVNCQSVDNMRVRYFKPMLPINTQTGEYIQMSKEQLEEAKGPEGFPGYKADSKVLNKGQSVRIFVATETAFPEAVLNLNQTGKVNINEIQENLRNSRYSVIMVSVVADPPKTE